MTHPDYGREWSRSPKSVSPLGGRMTLAVSSFEYEPLPYDAVLPVMLAAVAVAHGSSDFVVSMGADGTVERITYAEAETRSADMAARLLAAGVTKGVRVGILAPNGPRLRSRLSGDHRIGAVAVPINTFFQPAELHWVVRDADVHTLLAVDMLLGKDVLERIQAAAGGLANADGPLRVDRLPSYVTSSHLAPPIVAGRARGQTRFRRTSSEV
jgi:acyl-CoA synthetase (AMP-forming)/AMP-acid ligase II